MGDRYVEEVRAGGNASVREGRAQESNLIIIRRRRPKNRCLFVCKGSWARGSHSCSGIQRAIAIPSAHDLSLIHISEPTRPY